MKNYNWAVLGTGGIANAMAETLYLMGKRVYAAANRTYEKAVAYGEKYGIQKIYETCDELFDDPDIDIIYIASPHNSHYEYIIKALEAGKHILCEKAITMNSGELNHGLTLAKSKNLILAEAMTIYHMPLYEELKNRIDKPELGRVKLVQVNFGCKMVYDVNNRFYSKDLAGGALLDIGVYALSFAGYFLSAPPVQILTAVNLADTGVDEQSGIILKNKQGQMVVTALSFDGKQPKRGCIVCENGYIEIMEYPRAEKAVIYYTESNETEEITRGEEKRALEYEVCHMEEAVSMAQARPEEYDKAMNLMNIPLTQSVMEIMTDIRTQWGLTFSSETKF